MRPGDGPRPPIRSRAGRISPWPTGSAEHLGVPAVVVQNDADTAGLAEARFGAGKGYSPLLYLTIGSGIGGALILDGQIYRGGGLGAVEIGHLEVPVVSRAGARRWSSRQIASGWGIARQAREEALDQASAGRRDWVVLEWAHGDPQAITAELVARRPKRAMNGLAGFSIRPEVPSRLPSARPSRLLAPRRIILGGGVSLIGETHWFAPIRSWSTPTSSRLSAVRSTSCRPASARRSSFTGPWHLHSMQPGPRRR